jgi:hypothetical protein
MWATFYGLSKKEFMIPRNFSGASIKGKWPQLGIYETSAWGKYAAKTLNSSLFRSKICFSLDKEHLAVNCRESRFEFHTGHILDK